MTADTLRYCGIADCHGIESFHPYEERDSEFFTHYLRAEANRQRHAVAYMVELTEETVTQIKNKLEKKEFKGALVIMKSRCLSFAFPKRTAHNYQSSWEMIPNDRLDPYYSGEGE